ncbi:MAG: glycosyltransferase [Acidaminococcus sp.]|nr:glycosyltransferase [Acidaminococcus sp.]MCI2116741.1 glycosyltransferase [Acidaminococcus sp.]
MKILLVHRESKIDTAGGAAKVFFLMANELAKRHHEVSALALTKTQGKTFYTMSPQVHFINLNYSSETHKSLHQKFCRAFHFGKTARHRYDQQVQDPLWAAKIKPVIEKVQPDVIIAYTLDLARILLLSVKVACPLVIMFHRSADYIMTNLTPENKEALEQASCVQVLMPADIDRVKAKVHCRRLIRIPNAVRSLGMRSLLENKQIIHVGRFDRRQKRQHLLIEAFHQLQPEFADWKVDFWGEGDVNQDPYAKYCHDLVLKYGMDKQITFCGTGSQIPAKMKDASIFAFPSSNEGMSLALAEAMEVGLPVVAYKNCNSVNEMIQDGSNGFLCDDGVEPFAEALRQLMSDKELRRKFGAKAHESVRPYRPETVWNQWESLLHEITGK